MQGIAPSTFLVSEVDTRSYTIYPTFLSGRDFLYITRLFTTPIWSLQLLLAGSVFTSRIFNLKVQFVVCSDARKVSTDCNF